MQRNSSTIQAKLTANDALRAQVGPLNLKRLDVFQRIADHQRALMLAVSGILLGSYAEAQTVHQLGITASTPLQIPGVKWGLTKEHARKYFRDYGDGNFGLPYYNLMGIEFDVSAGFDRLDRKLDKQGKLTGATRRRVAHGLNELTFDRRGCHDAEYAQLRKVFLNKLEVAAPEKVTGQTDLKDRFFVFNLPNDQGFVYLFSRCDSPYEEYQWLSVRMEPGSTSEAADCREVTVGTKWKADSEPFYFDNEGFGHEPSWARMQAKEGLYYDNYCRKQYSAAERAKELRNLTQVGGHTRCYPARGSGSGYKVTCHAEGECKFERPVADTELQCE